MKKCALIVLATALAGCSSLEVLDEPHPIPSAVGSYVAPDLGVSTRDLAMDLDLTDCVEHAMLVEKKVFGGSSIEAQFPVRQIVAREFRRLIAENFHATDPGEEEDLCIKVRTIRVLLTDRFSKVTSDVSINVQIVHPSADRKPLFRKTYRSQSAGPFEDEDEVPHCFYTAVQQIVEEFATDISSDRKLVAYFKAKSAKGQNQ